MKISERLASALWAFSIDNVTTEARLSVKATMEANVAEHGRDYLSPLSYVEAAHQMAEASQSVLHEVVDEARLAGFTWSDIGKVLYPGRSVEQQKKSAHKRFADGLPKDLESQIDFEFAVIELYRDILSRSAEAPADDETLPEEYLLAGSDLVGRAAQELTTAMLGQRPGYLTSEINQAIMLLEKGVNYLAQPYSLAAIDRRTRQLWQSSDLEASTLEELAPARWTMFAIFQAVAALRFANALATVLDDDGDPDLIHQLIGCSRHHLAKSLATFVRPGPSMIIHASARITKSPALRTSTGNGQPENEDDERYSTWLTDWAIMMRRM